MKELIEYREKLLDRLEELAREFVEICKTRDPFTQVTGSDWNIHQFAVHVRDVDKFVYGERIRRTLSEDNPVFKSFDADVWMESHYKKDEPFEQVLDEFLKSVIEARKMLDGVPIEAWSRVSSHESIGGDLTLQLWVERSLAHIEEHLKAVK